MASGKGDPIGTRGILHPSRMHACMHAGLQLGVRTAAAAALVCGPRQPRGRDARGRHHRRLAAAAQRLRQLRGAHLCMSPQRALAYELPSAGLSAGRSGRRQPCTGPRSREVVQIWKNQSHDHACGQLGACMQALPASSRWRAGAAVCLFPFFLYFLYFLFRSCGTGAQGYLPRDYEVLDSKYGSEADLRACIRVLHEHGVSAIADIVLNHRCAGEQVGDPHRHNVENWHWFLVIVSIFVPDTSEQRDGAANFHERCC